MKEPDSITDIDASVNRMARDQVLSALMAVDTINDTEAEKVFASAFRIGAVDSVEALKEILATVRAHRPTLGRKITQDIVNHL